MSNSAFTFDVKDCERRNAAGTLTTIATLITFRQQPSDSQFRAG
jgi:hypothetical protein